MTTEKQALISQLQISEATRYGQNYLIEQLKSEVNKLKKPKSLHVPIEQKNDDSYSSQK